MAEEWCQRKLCQEDYPAVSLSDTECVEKIQNCQSPVTKTRCLQNPTDEDGRFIDSQVNELSSIDGWPHCVGVCSKLGQRHGSM